MKNKRLFKSNDNHQTSAGHIAGFMKYRPFLNYHYVHHQNSAVKILAANSILYDRCLRPFARNLPDQLGH